MAVIALFAGFIEVVATVALKFLLDARSPHVGLVVFSLIGFPRFVALLLFFCTLWLRRESLSRGSYTSRNTTPRSVR